MKAYKACDSFAPDYGCTVVFAANAKEAKKIAFCSKLLEDMDWINIRVKRIPELDDAYRGRCEIDWLNQNDRLAMVKYGFYCDDESFDPCECVKCAAREWCGQYEAWMDEIGEDNDE